MRYEAYIGLKPYDSPDETPPEVGIEILARHARNVGLPGFTVHVAHGLWFAPNGKAMRERVLKVTVFAGATMADAVNAAVLATGRDLSQYSVFFVGPAGEREVKCKSES